MGLKMTDKEKLKIVFKELGVKIREVEEYLYAAGRRYTFEPNGEIDTIIDYGGWKK